MIRSILIGAALVALAGCAIAPDTLRIEMQHDSHISQHFQATPGGNEWGVEAVMLDLHWQRGRWYADVADGVILNSRDNQTRALGIEYYGAMIGPRELFQARAGYEVPLK